jgi:hypothetical protein
VVSDLVFLRCLSTTEVHEKLVVAESQLEYEYNAAQKLTARRDELIIHCPFTHICDAKYRDGVPKVVQNFTPTLQCQIHERERKNDKLSGNYMSTVFRLLYEHRL